MHFRQRDHLKRHLLKSHHEGTWWICNICQKKYFNSYELKRHLLRHDSVKSFVCSECEKCFCTSSDLKRHQSVHSVVKQFCCGLCGKDFKHKCTVKMHFRKCVQIQNTWFCGIYECLVLYIFLWHMGGATSFKPCMLISSPLPSPLLPYPPTAILPSIPFPSLPVLGGRVPIPLIPSPSFPSLPFSPSPGVPTPQPARGSGESYKLPQWGLGKPQPTNDLVHIWAKRSSSGGNSFCAFHKNKCNCLQLWGRRQH